jgi:hypothetical protein
MDLPTSKGSMAAEWAGLSPQQRGRTAGLFLGLRQVLPETKRSNAIHLFGSIVDVVRDTADVAVSPESRDRLAVIVGTGSDPEGVAFIDHMDAIAREAVVEHLLPVGSRVYGCIATLQGGER